MLAPLGVFIAAPLVAEFLLGNMSIKALGMMAILAPLYGGGALLIRESVRRAGRGWMSIVLLAFAYGLIEEAFVTESLFNPDYLGLHLHLLNSAYIPSLGVGVWWSIFVLTLHTVWSITVPIALIEGLVPERGDEPWLGGIGIATTALLFMAAAFAIGSFSIRQDAGHFVASRAQFGWSAAACIAVVVLAVVSGRAKGMRGQGLVPNFWVTGLAAFVVASMFLVVPRSWGWGAVLLYVVLDAFAVSAIYVYSRRSGWTACHRLSVAGGAAFAYAWHAFVQVPAVGGPGPVTRIGNLVFAALAVTVVAVSLAKSRGYADQGAHAGV